VKLVNEDTASFVRETRERFDVVIVDQAEGPAGGEGPLAQSFYCDCFRILSGDGILVHRAGSSAQPQQRRELVARAGKVKRLFPIYRLYRAYPPAGEPGEILFGFASKRYDPLRDFDDSCWPSMGIETSYYSPELHRAAFALPRYFDDLLAGI
jgi:spermidine synthase